MPIIDNYITCFAPVRLFFEKWLFISCLVSFLWVKKRMITFNNLLQYYEGKKIEVSGFTPGHIPTSCKNMGLVNDKSGLANCIGNC